MDVGILESQAAERYSFLFGTAFCSEKMKREDADDLRAVAVVTLMPAATSGPWKEGGSSAGL
ncbi:hypothetical protein ABT275_35250 [Streptomyces sp. NPDC001185]|uniref:hypothetical protein n=1 Tax=Streptomyces sp. NPDC001185 TaxID=3154380 RepID=UPI00331E10E3